MNSNLIQKLRNHAYRKAFVASQINIGIPFQIRALLKSRPGWTQGTLADRTGMLQPRISGLMTPGKVRPNIETLRRIAEAFDCGLMVRFVPFSDLARWSEDFDPESFSVPSFENDTGFIEHKPEAATAGKALQQLAHGSLAYDTTKAWEKVRGLGEVAAVFDHPLGHETDDYQVGSGFVGGAGMASNLVVSPAASGSVTVPAFVALPKPAAEKRPKEKHSNVVVMPRRPRNLRRWRRRHARERVAKAG